MTVLARRIHGGREVSRPPRSSVRLLVGPRSIPLFAAHVLVFLSRGRRFSFVLAQGYGLAAAAANAAARLTRTPSAMLVCSPAEAYYAARQVAADPARPFRARELAAIRLLGRVNARLGRRYVVLSRYLADVVRGHGARGPVDVIPVYGVDTSIFRPSPLSRAELRRRRGLPESGFVIFNSSRIAPEKDSATLIRAFAALCRDRADIYLLHRSGGFRQFLAEAAAAGVDHRVIATDAVHPLGELPLDYAASDLCVQASRAEGLGYSVLEAMACGTPVVASGVGGLLETVIDGRTGWTYPAGDAGALATCIAQALDDPLEARRRAALGAEMVRDRYERSNVFAALGAVIRDAAQPRVRV